MAGTDDINGLLEDIEGTVEGDNDGTSGGDGDTGSGSTNSGDGDKGSDTGKSGDADNDTADGDSDGVSGTTDDGDDNTPDPLEELRSQQEELRQMLRVSRRDNAVLKSKLERLGKKPELDEDGNPVETDEPELSKIEELQQTLQRINETRGASLELLATQMAETKKYADVGEVCSRQNMDDILDAAATALHEQTGADFNELVLELEASIWSKQNPYAYLYDLIKTHHPKYQAASGKSGKNVADPNKKAASSIQDMGGSGDASAGGWTAEKIDAMPEDELHKVPADVYDKYLAGEMD